MSLGAVYLIRNMVNGMVYIGQTTHTVLSRWRDHHRKPNNCVALYRAIQKYGKESFALYTLATANTQAELDTIEQTQIQIHCSSDQEHGYNLRAGGARGKHQDSSKRKIAESLTGSVRTEECRKKISAAKTGVKTRRVYLTGFKHSQVTKAKMSAARKGKPLSETAKEKMSLGAIKRYQDPPQRLAASETAKVRGISPETRGKMILSRQTNKGANLIV
jgi:group I intron endonuclease